jgi:hypothetical protein
MDKELLYQTLNHILEAIEEEQLSAARTQLEGLIKEIQYGIYDK